MVAIPQSVKLKTAKGKATTDVNGLAEVFIPVPAEGRAIRGGHGIFEYQAIDDTIMIDLVNGADSSDPGFLIYDYFYDEDEPPECQGWFMLDGKVDLDTIIEDDPADLPGSTFVRIRGQKSNIATSDTLYVNIMWGERI